VTTEKGRELALALPTGSALVPGAILHVARELPPVNVDERR